MDDDHDNDDRGYGEKSRFAAHLDRGWDLLGHGDLARARASAQAAMSLQDDGAPDAHMLIAAIELADRRPHEAAAAYQRAIAADPEYPEPYLALAQVQLLDLEDLDGAGETCTEALALEGLMPIERIDATIMLCETALRQGRKQAPASLLESLSETSLLVKLLDGLARRRQSAAHGDVETTTQAKVTSIRARTKRAAQQQDEAVQSAVCELLSLPSSMFENDELEETIERGMFLSIRIARLFLELGKPARARALLEQITEVSPDDADAWSFLMEARLDLGQPRGGVLAALQSYRAESVHDLPAWAPSAEDLHRRVIEILAELPPQYLQRADEPDANLVVLVHESPSLELVLEGVDPRALSLALGLRHPDGSDSALTGFAIYRRNLVRVSITVEDFDRELDRSLREEIAAFFMLSDLERIHLGLLPGSSGPESLPSASIVRAQVSGDVANDQIANGGEAGDTKIAAGPESARRKLKQAAAKASAIAEGKTAPVSRDASPPRGKVKTSVRAGVQAKARALNTPEASPRGGGNDDQDASVAEPSPAPETAEHQAASSAPPSPASAPSSTLDLALKKLSRKRTRHDA